MLYSRCHFICQHSSLSCAVQLLLLHMPQCYVSLPPCCCMPYSCFMLYSSSHSAACRTVAAIVHANVLGYRVSYSCSCCTVTATVYATVLCVAVCCSCTVAAILYARVLCFHVPLPMLYSCGHCVCHSVMYVFAVCHTVAQVV